MKLDSKTLTTLAKYPFLSTAKEYVASLGLPLAEIIDHPVYSACVEQGRRRVLDCLANSFEPSLEDPILMENMILSYPIARIITNLTNSKSIINRYAQGEARGFEQLMDEDSGETIGLIESDLGLNFQEGQIPVIEYLRYATQLIRNNPGFKLVNRTVDGGLVTISDRERIPLLAEAVRQKVLEPVNTKDVPEKLKRMADNIKNRVAGGGQVSKVEGVDKEALPPCINHMLSLLETGESSHNVMFILATFFLGLGLNTDGVVGVFRRSPKFSEDKARYQISFLSGEQGTQYTCPQCATIKSYGLCKADCTVKHPLQYYRQARRR